MENSPAELESVLLDAGWSSVCDSRRPAATGGPAAEVLDAMIVCQLVQNPDLVDVESGAPKNDAVREVLGWLLHGGGGRRPRRREDQSLEQQSLEQQAGAQPPRRLTAPGWRKLKAAFRLRRRKSTARGSQALGQQQPPLVITTDIPQQTLESFPRAFSLEVLRTRSLGALSSNPAGEPSAPPPRIRFV